MNDEIEIYWWNLGKKTIDHQGSYDEYFKKTGMKIRKLPNKNTEKYRCTIEWCDRNATFDICSNKKDACMDMVKIYTTVLGDKTLFVDHRGRSHHINWYTDL